MRERAGAARHGVEPARASRLTAASLPLLVLALAPAAAQLAGPEFQVNSQTFAPQSKPAVAADDSGGFVVVWQGYDQDGSYAGVVGQRYSAAGSPAGSEFLVNTYTEHTQREPSVAMDGTGRFVVVWESYGQDGSGFGIFGQRFGPTGSKLGEEFQVNSFTTERQQYPAVAADGSGNFVVVWQSWNQSADTPGSAVFGQRFDWAGDRIGNEFQVNGPALGVLNRAAVAADDPGNFVVAWSGYNPEDSRWNVLGRRFDAAGAPLSEQFQINSYTTENQWAPAVAADRSGNFVVAWASAGQDGSTWGVFGQRFGPAGSRIGAEFQVNTYTRNCQEDPAVALDDAGNFVVAWQSHAGQDGSGSGVFGQRFALAGGPVGGEFQINTLTTSSQFHPAVAAGSSGDFVVAWAGPSQNESGYGILGQRLDTPPPACTADGDTLCLHHNRFRAEVTWTNYAGASGFGQAVPFTADSGLFWFFGPGNLEMLIKIVDGCALNQRYWVYAGATTDVEYTLTVADTWTDVAREYRNSLGHRAPAITDSGAFATCGATGDEAPAATSAAAPGRLQSAISRPSASASGPFSPASAAAPEGLSCLSGDHDLCLQGSRFRARITWTDYAGRTGSGWAVPYAAESGMFWFFDGDNIEFVVKVIDGCELNSRYWVYAAATTDVAYTLTVDDTLRDVSQTYTNILGTASPAITDSSAFATCP